MNQISAVELQQIAPKITPQSSEVIINVCHEAEFDEEHIPNTINIPLDQLSSQLDVLKNKQVIYVHCRSGKRSAQAVQILSQLDGVRVVDIQGGLLAWKESGLPTIRGFNRLPIMRQVFIAASILLWTSILGTYFLAPTFLVLAIIVATGFLISGVTGWCGMASLLALMPWNKQKKLKKDNHANDVNF